VPTWRSGRGGELWADLGSLRLVVHASDPDGGRVRFSVLRRQHGRGSPFALVASGVENDQLAAMDAAEALAANAGASLRTRAGNRGKGAGGAAATHHGQG
jgi:hypothetical protein